MRWKHTGAQQDVIDVIGWRTALRRVHLWSNATGHRKCIIPPSLSFHPSLFVSQSISFIYYCIWFSICIILLLYFIWSWVDLASHGQDLLWCGSLTWHDGTWQDMTSHDMAVDFRKLMTAPKGLACSSLRLISSWVQRSWLIRIWNRYALFPSSSRLCCLPLSWTSLLCLNISLLSKYCVS